MGRTAGGALVTSSNCRNIPCSRLPSIAGILEACSKDGVDALQHRGTLDHEEGPLKEGIDTTVGAAAHIGGKAQEYGAVAADKAQEYGSIAADKTKEVRAYSSTSKPAGACACTSLSHSFPGAADVQGLHSFV